MVIAELLPAVLLAFGAIVACVGCWLAARALFPRTVERARLAYGTRPVRMTIAGLVIALPLLTVGLILLNGASQPLLKLLGLFIAATPVLMGLLGSAGLSERIGVGLATVEDQRAPWQRSLRGGVVLSVTFLLPLVGWFVLLPMTLLSGVGATFAAIRQPRQPERLALASAA